MTYRSRGGCGHEGETGADGRARPAPGVAARPLEEKRADGFRDELRMREMEREKAAEQAWSDLDAAAEKTALRGQPGGVGRVQTALKAAVEDALRPSVPRPGGNRLRRRRSPAAVVRGAHRRREAGGTDPAAPGQRAGQLAIAARLDEIRGLLLDLYR